MLFEIYSDLVQEYPASCKDLYGRAVAEGTGLWLSVDPQAFPCLLLVSNGTDDQSDIKLRFIDVQFSRSCEITIGGSELVKGTFTIVRLNESDPEVVRVFLRLLEESFCLQAGTFNNRQIGDRILELSDLFSKLDETAGNILGLWGELYVILNSRDVPRAAKCWCLHKNAKHDFVSADLVVEVKTTLKSRRQHRFSLEQLRPLGKLDAYVASLQLVETHSGRTVSELLEAVHSKISDAELQHVFFRLCLTKGGRDIYRSDLRLQGLPTDNALALFHALDIPVPQVEPSAPITNVRFDVDLSVVTEIGEPECSRIMEFSNNDSKQ